MVNEFRHNHQSAAGFTAHAFHRPLDLNGIGNRSLLKLHVNGLRGGLEHTPILSGMSLRVEQGGDPHQGRNYFLQDLQPLAAHARGIIGEAGKISARSGETGDEAAADRIARL